MYFLFEYLRYNSVNYSIQLWAKQENMNELFNLYHAINIIDWKMKNKKLSDVSENECPWYTNDTLKKKICIFT